MITMLIDVDYILNKINWLSLHLLYVYYFMLCVLVYQFELHFMKDKMATMCAPSWFHVA